MVVACFELEVVKTKQKQVWEFMAKSDKAAKKQFMVWVCLFGGVLSLALEI